MLIEAFACTVIITGAQGELFYLASHTYKMVKLFLSCRFYALSRHLLHFTA
jgi:hypothetical protein